MSKAKTVTERLLGKNIRLTTGEYAGKDVVVNEISKDEKTLRCSAPGQPKKIFSIPVFKVETRGSKFFFIPEEEVMKTTPAKSAESGAAPVSHAAEAEAEEAAVLIDSKTAVTEPPEKIAPVESAESAENVFTVTCQFCLHTYPSDDGIVKPTGIANICPGCLTLAEDQLLASGLDGGDIVPEVVTEFLSRFYGMVNTNLNIVISGTTEESLNAQDMPEELPDSIVKGVMEVTSSFSATPDVELNLASDVDEFIFARRQIAKTLIATINAICPTAQAELGPETQESIILIFSPFDFELTALCGGYELVAIDGSDDTERGSEFVSLDELITNFTSASEDDLESVDDLEDAEDLDEVDEEDKFLPVDSFWRLQNCKPENNKKLVKIIEVLEPETADEVVKYRVTDGTGKKYKVFEHQLKPSVKTHFPAEAE